MTESREAGRTTVVPMSKVVTELEKVNQVGARQPVKQPEAPPAPTVAPPAAEKIETTEKGKRKAKEGCVGLTVQYWTEKYLGSPEDTKDLKPLAGILTEKLLDGKWNLAIGRGMHGMSGRAHGVPFSDKPKKGHWTFLPPLE